MKRFISYKTKNKQLNLWFLNDLHVGNNGFQKESLLSTIEKIKKDKNAVVILNGDLGDYIRNNDPRYLVNDVDQLYPDIEDQYFAIIDFLAPIKDKIIGVGMGNHEFTIWKHNGFNLTKMLATHFGVDYYEDLCLFEFTIGKKKHKVTSLVTHGCGGSGTIAGVARWISKQVQKMSITPDICAVGHFHKLDVITNPVFAKDMSSTEVKYLAVTGCYSKNYPDRSSIYASRNCFQPNIIGTVMFELFDDGRIQDHKIIEGY